MSPVLKHPTEDIFTRKTRGAELGLDMTKKQHPLYYCKIFVCSYVLDFLLLCIFTRFYLSTRRFPNSTAWIL